ncbi:probable E3 ubiquitin-protein ligase ARI7 [Chenopodium quinoa]|uniref:RBR-type E3 ubiquitin transferase n=1 Tax=Chenopodium quinoa TaxID=63459 RepID=A0A803MFJ4_CHEQI|nr:probable E3 ubiquitin-protein ligase ARI7 [Chenopodium quinoa]XP_021762674.1 probable E3 ubiquitin-protein ligase ARI7 [Chenopodium quinoa]
MDYLSGYVSNEDFYETDDDYSDDKANANYTILDEAEIRRRQEEQISHISLLLSLSNDQASLLLYHYNWKVDKLQDDWFADEHAVRDKVGLLINPINDKNIDNENEEDDTCKICYDELEPANCRSVSCGHKFCVVCWKSYISVAINDTGAGVLSLKCPAIKCQAAVTRDLIVELVSKEEKEKFDEYFVRSFVEGRKNTTKWCPAPGCDKAVEFVLTDGDSHRYDVTCVCSRAFCWNCGEETHRPVDCELVAKWTLKNSSEAENTKWILAYAKPCPMCKRPIEKTVGCNHMTCSAPCRFEFCWLCLGSWYDHMGCNRFRVEDRDIDEKMRKHAQLYIRRYSHYYERWASNHKSRQKAMDDLQRVEEHDLSKLSGRVNTPTTQLEFVVQGWKEIIECRRVLKWTYAYGYYLEEDKKEDKDFKIKKELFEFLQGQAETQLERLHSCAEIELSRFLKDVDGDDDDRTMYNPDDMDFSKYRAKLVDLTKVTGTHFEELLKALENGLPEVDLDRKIGRNTSKKRKDSASSSQGPQGCDHLLYGSWQCDQCTLH